MTALEEIRVKLNGAQTDLEKLEFDFQKLVDLKDSLHSADTSLKASAGNVSNMVVAMERSTQAMKDCISTLQSATSLISKFEPIEIAKNQDHFLQELRVMKAEVGAVARESNDLPRKIEEAISSAAARQDKTSGSIVFLTLLVLASLVASVVNLYLTHGDVLG